MLVEVRGDENLADDVETERHDGEQHEPPALAHRATPISLGDGVWVGGGHRSIVAHVRLATLFALLARDVERGHRERFEPGLRDRLATALAVPVRPGVDALDSTLYLRQQVEPVRGDG